MTERQVLLPSAAHPITITPTGRRVTVTVGGAIVAQSDGRADPAGVDLSSGAVHPRADVVSETLTRERQHHLLSV